MAAEAVVALLALLARLARLNMDQSLVFSKCQPNILFLISTVQPPMFFLSSHLSFQLSSLLYNNNNHYVHISAILVQGLMQYKQYLTEIETKQKKKKQQNWPLELAR